jgi:hypothetical protein
MFTGHNNAESVAKIPTIFTRAVLVDDFIIPIYSTSNPNRAQICTPRGGHQHQQKQPNQAQRQPEA